MCIVTASFQCIFRRSDTCRSGMLREDPHIFGDLVRLEEDLGEDGVKA